MMSVPGLFVISHSDVPTETLPVIAGCIAARVVRACAGKKTKKPRKPISSDLNGEVCQSLALACILNS
jgi:hypothetical protein